MVPVKQDREGILITTLHLVQVRSTFKDADNVKGYVIFDIRKNRYRLATVIHFAKTTNHV